MAWHTIQQENSPHFICSVEQEEESLQTFCLDTYLSELAKSRNTQGTFCSQDSETGFCQPSQSGTMFAASTEHPGKDQLMFFAEGSHAKTSVPLEQTTTSTGSSLDSTEKNRVFGDTWLGSLWKCSLDLRLLKTHPISGLKDLSPSSKTLTRWGITQGGLSLGVDMSVQTTTETECGYLPTPTCHNAKEGAYPAEFRRRTPTLAAQIGGKVNPDWNESRMGWPIGWTDLGPLGMDRIAEWQQAHSIFSQKD